MNYPLIKAAFQKNAAAFGTAKAFQELAFRAANHIIELKILKFVTITQPDPAFLPDTTPYTCGFLSTEQLLAYAENPEYQMTPEFVLAMRQKGDECYGILDGDTLTSYGWYSNAATEISEGFTLHFNSDYIYMYKGYTHPGYRGQRLHAIGMTAALDDYLRRGFKGLVSFVEATNFSSLKSCYRMGYRDIGAASIVGGAGRSWILSSAACKPYGIWIEDDGAPQPGKVRGFRKS